MGKALATSQPGLFAYHLRRMGEHAAIALLGIGVIESGGTPDDDERIAAGYADIAADSAPHQYVRQYWDSQIEAHPWRTESMRDLLAPLQHPAPTMVAAIAKGAAWLAKQSLSGAESAARADLLGRVLLEIIALDTRQLRAAFHMTSEEATLDVMLDGQYSSKMRSFEDRWAGSGTRAVGVAALLRMEGKDPQQVTWTFLEADLLLRAICAINAVAFELGDNVRIFDGKEHKTAWLAAYAKGELPFNAFAFNQIPEPVIDGSRE